jgi:NADPH:quinone reductase-like Zn-dependent oxidoreductase
MAEMMRAYARGADPAEPELIAHAVVPVPEIDADELLVRVQAVGVGTHDARFLPDAGVRPYPIGMEGAGVVAQVGAAVSGYEVGDRIAFISAVRAGWRVVASASAGSLGHLRALGADTAVDYRGDWRAQVRSLYPGGVDAAVAIPSGTTAAAMEGVRDQGSMITVSADDVAPVRGIRVSGLDYAAGVRAPLQHLLEEVQAGRFPLHIDLQLPLERADDALAKVRAQRARGKTVLTIDE